MVTQSDRLHQLTLKYKNVYISKLGLKCILPDDFLLIASYNSGGLAFLFGWLVFLNVILITNIKTASKSYLQNLEALYSF